MTGGTVVQWVTAGDAVRLWTMSADEYRAYAEHVSTCMLGVPWAEALRMVRAGELLGTLAETRIKLLASLLEDEQVSR
jgi:hypothetical protein